MSTPGPRARHVGGGVVVAQQVTEVPWGPRPWTLLKTHPLGLAGNLRWRLTQGTGFWRPSATVPPEGVLSKAPRPGPGSDKPPLRWHLSSSLPTVDSSTARHCTSRQRTHLKGQGCFRRARGRGESGGEAIKPTTGAASYMTSPLFPRLQQGDDHGASFTRGLRAQSESL